MNILVCVKRVPATGGRMALTPDAQEIDTHMLGFTVSPHEECAVEESVRLVEKHGGSSAVLTLGPDAATEQLRDAMALGIDRAVLLETDGREFDPIATADALVKAIQAEGGFDLLLFGNESADSGGYQVPIRVAHALGLPVVAGIKELEIQDGKVIAKRQSGADWEIFEAPVPAVVTVKEGINLPRYPSLPGRLKAKKKEIKRYTPEWRDGGLVKLQLKVPVEQEHRVEILGNGPDAAPKVADVLAQLGLI